MWHFQMDSPPGKCQHHDHHQQHRDQAQTKPKATTAMATSTKTAPKGRAPAKRATAAKPTSLAAAASGKVKFLPAAVQQDLPQVRVFVC